MILTVIGNEPPVRYMATGGLLRYEGYEFYGVNGQLVRIYAVEYTDRSEIFTTIFDGKQWQFDGGMSPVDYPDACLIARNTFEENT